MELNKFIQVVEVVTLIITLLMLSVGIAPLWQMYKTNSTENVPYHMFLLSAICCLGMFHYGLLVGNGLLIILDGMGAILQTTYTFLYLLLVKSKVKPLTLLLMAVLYEIALYTYIFNYQEHTAERADTLGTCTSFLSTFLMLLPAFEVIDNIRNKNGNGTPTSVLIVCLMCSASWLTYGIMLHDPNIYAPNIPRIFILAIKLCLIFSYGDVQPDKKTS